jgi:hypothetical protein
MFIGAMNMKIYQFFFVSPGFFPAILGVLFVLFGLALLYTSSIRGGAADARRLLSASNLRSFIASPVLKKGGVVFLLILGYVALLGEFDFVLLSAAYLMLTFFFLRAAKWYWIIAVSVVAPVLVQLLFSNIFRIPMP